ncbi:MAG: hypothetical protein PHT48_01500 [Dechloromonas sp.]|nr:hypothetical protein [Dechloromonas sp.]
MNLFRISAVVAALLGVTACASQYADVPAPTRFKSNEQLRLQAAEHWRAIADHVAAQVASDVRSRLGTRALYIPLPHDEQAFVSGFRELLITALVQQGLPVSVRPEGAMTVDVAYSIYKFQPDRLQNTYYYGEATMLAAGLWALGGVIGADVATKAGVDAGVKLLTIAAGLDGFSWLNGEVMRGSKQASGSIPRSEILLTVTLVDGDRMVSRSSNIYYATDEDKALYWDRPGAGYTLKVRGD